MAHNSDTNLFYVMSREACGVYVKRPSWNPKKIPLEPGQMFLRAIDIETGKRVWEVPQIGPADSWGGVLSAGGVISMSGCPSRLLSTASAAGTSRPLTKTAIFLIAAAPSQRPWRLLCFMMRENPCSPPAAWW